MKVKNAIKILIEIDPDAELIWHDAIEGNDCEVESLYPHISDSGNKEVYVSCCTKEQMDEIFHTGKNLSSICRSRNRAYRY